VSSRQNTITVRSARPDDYDAVAQLTVAAYRADGQLSPDHPYERTLSDAAARAAHGHLLVAEEARTGAVVGTVLFVLPGTRYAELSRPGEAEFRMLAVDPPAQGRGVGEILVRACLDRAAELRCHAVVIYTRDVARAAQRLYDRLGFDRVPDRDWTPAPGVHLLALRLRLPAGDVRE
jgi:ribosomal protein S18 acetylase RimI-like enzyme